MNVKRQKLSDTKIKLTISSTEAEIANIKQAVLQKLARNVKVAGFRTGKVPLSVAEKNIDENQLQSGVLQEVVQQGYQKAVVDGKLRTLSAPEVSVVKFVPFREVEFTAEVEVMPDVKLGEYLKIKKALPKVAVSEKDVADVLENLCKQAAEKKESQSAAQNGDEVIVDFDGVDSEGKAVAGASGKDYPLTLGSSTFIPGFEEGLIGLKTGDTKELKLRFPKDYHAVHLAGTAITFKVSIKKVNHVVLPVIDDAFAAKVSPFKSLGELKADVKAQLEEQKTTEASNKVKDEIVEEIVKKSKFSIPEVLIADQIQSLEQDFTQNLTYRGITKSEYLKQQGYKNEDEWRDKELKPQAERRVSVGIILAAISEKENISVSTDEVATRTQVYKQQYQQQAGQFDTPKMQREVASRLLTEKTVEFLYQEATKK